MNGQFGAAGSQHEAPRRMREPPARLACWWTQRITGD